VTRPTGQAERLCASLARCGWRVFHQPLLELEPIEQLSPAQRRCVMELDIYGHVIFVSGNAVRFGMEHFADYWPQLPVGINWYAVGEATARLLETRGVTPISPGQAMTSEGLLALAPLQSIKGQRVLIVRGEGGRTLLKEELIRRGARVDEFACYRRQCPELPPGALSSLLEESGIQLILISSGEGLANLRALLSPEETTKFRHITLLVPSQRVAAQAAVAGFEQVVVAENASDSAMLRAVEAFTPGSGE
jgi:uroporphyrinogen-III synthase